MRSLSFALLVATTLSASPGLAASARPDAGRLTAAMSAQPLRRLGGGSLAWSSLKGEVVVLHFWASWCAPCRRELPQIQALHLDLARTGGRVVAVSIDTDRRNAADFAARYAPSLPIYHDAPEGLAKTLDLPALPYTVVLDRDGAVLWAGGGADTKTRDHYTGLAQRAAAAATPAAESTEGPSR
jgi:thiol-disulfide isomerase/thioredoxin